MTGVQTCALPFLPQLFRTMRRQLEQLGQASQELVSLTDRYDDAQLTAASRQILQITEDLQKE